ncbi:hypothetical protein HAX54_048169 [Datura stramonium]|uniref:Wall-associated receptor kinase galacturonan-binding domain-containing protein n=1 Tax=Datura stramonium TaxID=4076 RepID=A0ABS8SU35_DATST|nr:hypothetical protein [Datura stramonium]
MYGGAKFLTVLILLQLSEIAFAERNQQCVPSSCGHIHNISYPFRLKSDPKHCGLENYELSCEGDRTIFSYGHNESYHYVVQAINYDNSTVRLVDPDIREQALCSLSLPQHSRRQYDIGFTTWKYKPGRGHTEIVKKITIFSCPFAINSPVFAEITNCLNRSSYASNVSSDLFKGHTYATMDKFSPSDLEVGCSVDLTSLTSWHTEDANANISILSLHNALAYGFELSWFSDVYCDVCKFKGYDCEGENSRDVRCIDLGCKVYNFIFFRTWCGIVPWMLPIVGLIIAVRVVLFPLRICVSDNQITKKAFVVFSKLKVSCIGRTISCPFVPLCQHKEDD